MCVCVCQRPNTTLWVSSSQPLHLIVCVSEDGQANGDLFWDNGDSLDTFEKDDYAYITFSLKQVEQKHLTNLPHVVQSILLRGR